jgi:hypothetical protein
MFAALNLALFAYQLKPIQTTPIEREADPTKLCIFKTPQKITFLCNFVPESKFSVSQVTGRQYAQ